MSRENLQTIGDMLVPWVRQAGDMLRRGIGRTRRIRHKSRIDLVTDMDHAVERRLVRNIRRRFPGHAILSEELEEGSRRNPWRAPPPCRTYRWIIDPVDGTTNYAHGFPHFSVSVGIEREGDVVLGAVYNPMLDECFFARRGHGAFRNGRRIRVSRVGTLERALLATGFPYDVRTSRKNNFGFFQAMARRCQAVRRAGSASLDLCDLACGRFDGFWELKLKPWDVAAGALMIREAEGRLTDFSGRTCDIFAGDFIGSNGRLHGAMVRTLAAARRRARPAA